MDGPTGRREFLRLAGLALVGVACSKPVRSGGGTPSPTPGTPAPTSPSPTPTLRALAWRPLAAAGPSARRDYSFVADAEGRRAFLFGGRAGSGALSDLWEYDVGGGAWTKVNAPGPEPRFGHNAAFLRGRMAVFGGQGGPAAFFNDLWTYDPAAKRWEKDAAPRGPVARYGAGGTAVGADLLISHGFTDDRGRFDDTWTFGEAWTNVTPPAGRPLKRCLHRIAYLPSARKVVLFGGQTTGVPALGDTWTLDVAARSWSKVEGPAPPKRNLYAIGATQDRVYVFGGNGESGALNDLWSFDGAAWTTLSPAGTPPGPRGGIEGAVLPDGRMLVFGGRDGSKDLADLWELTLPL